MFNKLSAAFLSALFLSAVFTFSQDKSSGDVLYYSPVVDFYMGSAVLLAFYVLIGIPLSVLADKVIRRRASPFRAGLMRMIAYFGCGAAFGLLFLLFRRAVEPGSAVKLLVLFGLAGAVFAFFCLMLDGLRKFLRKIVMKK